MINEKLKDYIEKTIFPINNKNDEGHNIKHVEYCIRRSLFFAKQVPDINLNMVYTIAAYHDIAHHIDPKNHEVESAKYLLQDKKLEEFFTKEEIATMAEAIEDHRASKEDEPRSIYGKIISSADRNTNIIQPLKRTYSYRIKQNPQYSLEEIIAESRTHLIEKYNDKNGYALDKMYFEDPEYDKYIKELNELLRDEIEFEKKYLEVNEITKN